MLLVGCGYLGGAWLQQASAALPAGSRVWVLARTPRPLPPRVQPIWADLHHPQLAARLPAAAMTTVIFCAAADSATEAGYRHLYVEGTARLLAALSQRGLGPRRLIWTSSTSVYEQDAGAWVHEATATCPPHWRGQQMLRGEAQAAAGPWQLAVLRLAGLYGPGRMRLLSRLQQGWSPGPRRQQWTNRIHQADAVTVLNHLICAQQVPPLLIGADDLPATLGHIADTVAGHAPAPTPESTTGKRCSNALLRRQGITLAYPTFVQGFSLRHHGLVPPP